MTKKIKIYKVFIGIILALAVLILIVLMLRSIYWNKIPTVSDGESSEEAAQILDEASEIEDEGETILLIPKDEVYSFSMTDSHGILLDFAKEDDEWIYLDDADFNINQDRIDKILNYITDIKFIDVNKVEDGTDYGLDQESPVYIISDANGNSTIISIGNIDESTGYVYFALNYDFTNIYVNQGKLHNVGKYTIEELLD